MIMAQPNFGWLKILRDLEELLAQAEANTKPEDLNLVTFQMKYADFKDFILHVRHLAGGEMATTKQELQ